MVSKKASMNPSVSFSLLLNSDDLKQAESLKLENLNPDLETLFEEILTDYK